MYSLPQKCCVQILNSRSIGKQLLFISTTATRQLNSRPSIMDMKNPLLSGPQTFGQPTHTTHPHLLAEDEVTPLIKTTEYQNRRQKLMEFISEEVIQTGNRLDRHLVVIPSATKQFMSNQIPYFFRQNTDFSYLSGCQEPDSCLVLASTGSKGQHYSALFMRQKDVESELWDGPRTGPYAAPAVFGVDTGLPVGDLASFLDSFLKSGDTASLWYEYTGACWGEVHKTMNNYVLSTRNRLWESPAIHIHQVRIKKSPAEVQLLQKSSDIAADAIKKAIQLSRPGWSEHEIHATVEYECKMNGAQFLAYPPVVAGGTRANTIHYITNNQKVKDGEMVLMDAGCEYYGYTSDITRTWPIGGTFNSHQKALYEMVLNIESALLEYCREFPSVNQLHKRMGVLLGKGLQEMGLVPKIISSDQSLYQASKTFCQHHVSHYLGMDVHDTPTISKDIPIQPGMVITLEPGVYISERQQRIPSEYRGIGIRIEDDILITENGPVVLTRNCPKTIEDIEKNARQNQQKKPDLPQPQSIPTDTNNRTEPKKTESQVSVTQLKNE